MQCDYRTATESHEPFDVTIGVFLLIDVASLNTRLVTKRSEIGLVPVIVA
jgi:hypothetical protein